MPADDPRTRFRLRGGLRSTTVVLALGAALFSLGALGPVPRSGPAAAPAGAPAASAGTPAARGGGPDATVESLRARVRRLPSDAEGWAALGMAYVQQARSTADPATYGRAEAALRRSLDVQPSGNAPAATGMGALEAARHRFGHALTWARRAVEANPYSAPAHGVLADALTQLGRYEESFEAVQRMCDLKPDSAALARASYSWELRGDTGRAVELMTRSLGAAGTPAETAFARTHLSTLALESGRAQAALRHAEAGLAAVPGDAALLEARARARTVLGQTPGAVADFTAALAVAPLPQYLLGLGDLRLSVGDTAGAEAQYDVLRAQETLRRSGGEAADADAILFEADHGDPATAVRMGRTAVRERPFLAVHDALGWALHRAGRDREALEQADSALRLGTASAPFHYHRGLINRALGQPEAEHADLRRALAIDPRFHPVHAPRARTALSRIGSTR
ncbi:Tetratricopeptide repeat protein [Streptomyces sp. ADI96-02]|uniref:tetratricopeptide repeat protein n=1 Tax=Streptomyces sp. ADI96-02 TaxID=1522760 RepID=UPI000FBC152E|nr:tetratricopeptide repeat protein [Streptomyces sp. ADI96-02]RPK55771.1 Tetratricopeptide repeat protein [Streptomyces sp. ADI96-02]